MGAYVCVYGYQFRYVWCVCSGNDYFVRIVRARVSDETGDILLRRALIG